MFVNHAPNAYDEALWNQHLVRIGKEYSDDQSSRAQATIHWLECLIGVLRCASQSTSESCADVPSSRKRPVSDAELDRLVLCLAKLGIDRRSDFVLRRAAVECLNAAIVNASEQTVSLVRTSSREQMLMACFLIAGTIGNPPRRLFPAFCQTEDARQDCGDNGCCHGGVQDLEKGVCIALFS